MKKIISALLVFCLCTSFCACNADTQHSSSVKEQETSTPTEAIEIQSGLTIDRLKSFASSSGVKDYQEVEIDNEKKEFSFTSAGIAHFRGVASGENVIEFSLSLTNVIANTSDEFAQLAYVGFQDFGKLTYNQVTSALSVMYVLDIYVMLGGSKDITLAEGVAVITDKTELEVNDWSISADFDTVDNTITISAKYQK